MKIFFVFFWSSSPNLRAKSIPKKNNKGFGAKYSPDRCRIPNLSGLGCLSVPPPKFLCPPQTNYSGSVPGTILFYSQCTIYTVVCDHIANKLSSFVLLHATILRKYRGKPFCNLQVFCNLSNQSCKSGRAFWVGFGFGPGLTRRHGEAYRGRAPPTDCLCPPKRKLCPPQARTVPRRN